MPRLVSKLFAQIALAATSVILLSACQPVGIAGLSMEIEGSQVAVLAKRTETPTVLQAGQEQARRFWFSTPLPIPSSSDLGIRIEVQGSVDIAVYAGTKDKQPFLQASFEGLGEPLLELRLPLPAGSTLAGVEVTLGSAQRAVLRGFSLSAPYVGFRAGTGDGLPALVSLGVRRFYASEADSWPQEVQLPAASGPGWSVMVRQGGSGILQILGASEGFETLTGLERPLAIPLEVLGGTAVSIRAKASGTPAERPALGLGATAQNQGGIAEAWFHFGGKAPLADLHAILGGVEMAGDYKLYRWDLLPDTLVFDFADYAVQDRYFKRLAFFAEKPGFRGRLAEDRELAGLHGWNAHDYPPWTLANFYNLAVETAFKLNTSELALLDLLLDHGIVLKEPGGRLRPGRGAIISITRQATPAFRRIFMDHEASHALFFQDEPYRKLSETLWNAHDPGTRRFWIRHLRWRHYDTTDQYLNVNELQAYLVQQSAQRAVGYIRDNVLVRLAAAYPMEAENLARDTPAILATSARDAAALDVYLREYWNIAAGRFGRVRRIPLL